METIVSHTEPPLLPVHIMRCPHTGWATCSAANWTMRNVGSHGPDCTAAQPEALPLQCSCLFGKENARRRGEIWSGKASRKKGRKEEKSQSMSNHIAAQSLVKRARRIASPDAMRHNIAVRIPKLFRCFWQSVHEKSWPLHSTALPKQQFHYT
jgi:hypothetical protein